MSNYDTDVFVPILEAIRVGTGAKPYTGKVRHTWYTVRVTYTSTLGGEDVHWMCKAKSERRITSSIIQSSNSVRLFLASPFKPSNRDFIVTHFCNAQYKAHGMNTFSMPRIRYYMV